MKDEKELEMANHQCDELTEVNEQLAHTIGYLTHELAKCEVALNGLDGENNQLKASNARLRHFVQSIGLFSIQQHLDNQWQELLSETPEQNLEFMCDEKVRVQERHISHLHDCVYALRDCIKHILYHDYDDTYLTDYMNDVLAETASADLRKKD